MIKRTILWILCVMSCLMLAACGGVKDMPEAEDAPEVENMQPQEKPGAEAAASQDAQQTEDAKEPSQPSAAENFNFDYEALGIEKYDYPQEFSMGDDLRTAVEQLALTYENFSEDSVSSEGWPETFIARFIQNSMLSFSYLDAVSDKNEGEIGADELNYIQYSLTGVYLDVSSYTGGSVNRFDAASPLVHGTISDWSYEYTDAGVTVAADLEIRSGGSDAAQARKITVLLIQNPYSCFDGYSIASISSENAEPDVSSSDDSAYVGEYLDEDNEEPNLEIARNGDGKYIVQIGIFRLTSLSDGVGELTADGMNFRATDASGNPISGTITVDGETATVTFTDSTWEYLPNGTAFRYRKSSGTPNVWEY